MKETKHLLPFEDNLIIKDRKAFPVLFLYKRKDPKDKKRYKTMEELQKHMVWHVIDSINGIAYETEFCRATEAAADFQERTGHILLSNEWERKRTSLRYYDKLERIGDLIVFRIFRYHPLLFNEPQGMYEIFRIIFGKDGAWQENRTEMLPLEPYMVYQPGSVLKHIVSLEYNKSDFLCGQDQLMLYQIRDELKSWNIFKFPNAYEDGIDLKYLCSVYFRSIKKQHYNKNVPAEVIEHLNLESNDPLPGYYIAKQHNECVYISKDHWYLFKKNVYTEQWSSSNRVGCLDLLLSYRPKEKIIGDTSKAWAGTMLEQCFYNCKLKVPFLWAMEQQKKYLSLEQALKIHRYDLFDTIFDHISFLEKAKKMKKSMQKRITFNGYTAGTLLSHPIDPKDDLSKVLGISGRQIKLYPKFGILMDYYTLSNTNSYCKQLAPEIRGILYSFVPVSVLNHPEVCRYIQNHPHSVQFLNAVAKRLKKENYDVAMQELMDYCIMGEYLKTRVTEEERIMLDEIYPKYTSPSKIKELHDRILQLNIMYEQRCDAEENERKLKIEQNIPDLKKKNKRMEYENEYFKLVLPKNADEIRKEGFELLHCVGRYVYDVGAGNTTILFLRRQSNPNRSFMTMEVTNNGVIAQFFGLHDSFNKDPEVRDFVKEYAEKKKYRIGCKIFE